MADHVMRDFPAAPRQFDLKKVSWGAIWGGVMVTIGMEALFLSFGIFIAAIFGGSTAWSMAWYLVTMAVSFYVGALSAARLSDVADREISVLHGLSTWGLATLATALIGGVVGWALAVNTGATLSSGAWGPTEQWGGVIWGGILLSLITAYLGGASGVPRARVATREEDLSAEPSWPPATR
jgi:hypothetical protein